MVLIAIGFIIWGLGPGPWWAILLGILLPGLGHPSLR